MSDAISSNERVSDHELHGYLDEYEPGSTLHRLLTELVGLRVLTDSSPASSPQCKHDWVGDNDCAYCALDEARVRVTELESAAETFGDWRPANTAPMGVDVLFRLRPITVNDPHFVDTSGNPILGAGSPRIVLSRYGRWSSLEIATHWHPLPKFSEKSEAPHVMPTVDKQP